MKRRAIPIHRLARAFSVHPGEGTTTALLLGLLLILNAGNTIGGSAIQALFFARFGVQFLPIMFILLGIMTFVSTMGMSVLISRIAPVRVYVGLPLVVAALVLVERGFVALDPSWLYPVLWLSMNVFVSLLGIAAWGLAGAVWDTRQAKRLFPVVTAGGILGAVVGGIAIQPRLTLSTPRIFSSSGPEARPWYLGFPVAWPGKRRRGRATPCRRLPLPGYESRAWQLAERRWRSSATWRRPTLATFSLARSPIRTRPFAPRPFERWLALE